MYVYLYTVSDAQYFVHHHTNTDTGCTTLRGVHFGFEMRVEDMQIWQVFSIKLKGTRKGTKIFHNQRTQLSFQLIINVH